MIPKETKDRVRMAARSLHRNTKSLHADGLGLGASYVRGWNHGLELGLAAGLSIGDHWIAPEGAFDLWDVFMRYAKMYERPIREQLHQQRKTEVFAETGATIEPGW